MSAAEDILSQIRTRRARVTREVITQRILGLADRHLPRFRNVFISAVRMGRNVSLDKIAHALRVRDVAAVEAIIPWATRSVPALAVTLPAVVLDLIIAAARTAERLLPAVPTTRTDAVEIRYRLDLTNPLAVQVARDHAADLVKQITEETLKAIQNVIARALEEGIPPRAAAIEIRETIGLTERQEAALAALRQQGASDRTLMIARARMIRERADLIARTETMWASNEGQHVLWQQMIDARLIDHATAQREFIVTPDDRLCPVCAPLNGNLYTIGQQIVTKFGAVDSPPVHPNCRCVMALVVS